MGIDFEKLKQTHEEQKNKHQTDYTGGLSFIKRKDIKLDSEIVVRVLQPLENKVSRIYQEITTIWINRTPFVCAESVGDVCETMGLVRDHKNSSNFKPMLGKDQKNFTVNTEYLIPVYELIQNEPIGGVKILECTRTLKDGIMDILLDDQFADFGENRILDYDKGLNIRIKKTQGKSYLEYEPTVLFKPTKVVPPSEIPDLLEYVSNRVCDPTELMVTYLDYLGISNKPTDNIGSRLR